MVSTMDETKEPTLINSFSANHDSEIDTIAKTVMLLKTLARKINAHLCLIILNIVSFISNVFLKSSKLMFCNMTIYLFIICDSFNLIKKYFKFFKFYFFGDNL